MDDARFHVPFDTKIGSFWRRYSQPISWLGTVLKKPYPSTKLANNTKPVIQTNTEAHRNICSSNFVPSCCLYLVHSAASGSVYKIHRQCCRRHAGKPLHAPTLDGIEPPPRAPAAFPVYLTAAAAAAPGGPGPAAAAALSDGQGGHAKAPASYDTQPPLARTAAGVDNNAPVPVPISEILMKKMAQKNSSMAAAY